MYINVLVETKVKANDMTFTYHADSNYKENLIGKRVLVPFSNRIVEGFALEYTTQPKDYVAKDGKITLFFENADSGFLVHEDSQTLENYKKLEQIQGNVVSDDFTGFEVA